MVVKKSLMSDHLLVLVPLISNILSPFCNPALSAGESRKIIPINVNYRMDTKVRLTRQRRVILEELKKTTAHPTAGELYDTVRRRLPRISLATVYRNLELLAGSGVIQKLELSGSPARFDGRPEDHYHIRCTQCGRVEDLPLMPLPELEGTLQKASNYQITGLRLDCAGICPACRA